MVCISLQSLRTLHRFALGSAPGLGDLEGGESCGALDILEFIEGFGADAMEDAVAVF